MKVYISGSLAYDRIMSFPGRFADHILPDKIHILNVCFNINGLVERFGGTAGNIAYNLALLEENPAIVATAGQDFGSYMEWLQGRGVDTGCIEVITDTHTASAYITTDLQDNQITAFNPGAMAHPTSFSLEGVEADEALVVIAPGNRDDMARYSAGCRERGIPFIFDPGQSLNIWDGPDLADAIEGARFFVSNDYELALTLKMTGMDRGELLGRVGGVVTTMGEKGSIVATSGGEKSVPAAEAGEVRDPTGAGDAYRAGFIKGISLGLDLDTCALVGGMAAVFAVERQGTQEHSYTLAEFNERLQEEFGFRV